MKILLIENRIERLEKFSKIKEYKIIDIYTGEKIKKLKEKIAENNLESLNSYSAMMLHSSYFTQSERSKIKNYCQNNKYPLVFFSGGISQATYDSKKFPFLNIGVKDFYSEKLIQFIQHTEQTGTIELRLLQFGPEWKLSLLYDLRNNLSNIIYQYESQTKNNKICTLSLSELEKLNQHEAFELLDEVLKEKFNHICKVGSKIDHISSLEELKKELNEFIKAQ